MVLSIGMIVKNEEKYLERCLTALQPILDELDSELIIADTGSTDSTVEIAKKFTDNVFHFDWINDFSAARNSTLERAKGEWFMFIDADEVAQDCTDIIKFFKSGEYKKYKSALYVQSSFTDAADLERPRVDYKVVRLTEINGVTKFVNPIHELLEPCYNPVKELDFVVDHYGYLYRDDNSVTELAVEKSARNLEYLFKELEKLSDDEINKSHFLIYSQIADSYETINQMDKALEYLNIGLDRLDHNNFAIIAYYSHKISILSNGEEIEKNLSLVIDVINECFDLQKHPWHKNEYSSDCFLYAIRAYAFYRKKYYGRAIDDSSKFIDLYGKHKKGKLNNSDLLFVSWKITDYVAQTTFDIFYRCCYQEGQFSLADKYVKDVPLEKYLDNHDFIVNHLKIRVVIMENVGYQNFDVLYGQLDEFGRNYLISLVRPKVFKAKPENRTVIIKKLASLGGVPSELAEIYRGYFEKGNANADLISLFLGKYGSANGEDMLYLLMSQNLDITPFVCSYDFFADRAVQFLFVNYEVPMSMFEDYDITVISGDGLVNSTILYGWIMLRAFERGFPITKVFEKYGNLGLRWYEEFGNYTELPENIRAAILVNNVVSAKKTGNKTQFMSMIRKLKGVVPDLIPLVDTYEGENKDEFKGSRINSEFEQLAIQVKQNIRDLIAAGNIGDARKLIKEYEEICPNDPEVETLKDEINNSLQ